MRAMHASAYAHGCVGVHRGAHGCCHLQHCEIKLKPEASFPLAEVSLRLRKRSLVHPNLNWVGPHLSGCRQEGCPDAAVRKRVCVYLGAGERVR